MDQNKPTNKKYNIVFSETAASVIGEIEKKYGLEQIEEKMLKEMGLAKVFSEKEKIFETLPGRQIAKIVKEAAQGKIGSENLYKELQKRLNIPSEDAKNMALELQEKILILARKVPVGIGTEKRTKGVRPTTMIKPAPKEFMERPKRIEKESAQKVEKKSTKQDVYREPLE